jgi:phosphoglycolate phosphatase
MVGNGILKLVERALPEQLRTTEYVLAAREDFLAYYVANIDRYTRPYDGIREVLHTLQEESWTLAVASNKFDSGTKQLVASIFPEVDFRAIYGNKEGFPLKPDAALIDLIIKECGAEREATTMIGDSGVDMQTAKNGGVRSIGCTWGFRSRAELEEWDADVIVDSPLEILQVLR